MAVIENPFAGRFVEDLAELVKTGEELGDLLGRRAVAALGAPVHSYGKAAVVGERRRVRARRGDPAPDPGHPVPCRGGRRQGDHPVGEEARRARHGDRRAAPLQGRGVRAHPFRRDGGAAGRRAAGETRSWSPSWSPTAAGRMPASAA